MDIIAPIVLRASPVDWKVLSEAQPGLNIDIVPRKYRPFFPQMISLVMRSLMNLLARPDIILGHRRSHHRKVHLDGHRGPAAPRQAALTPGIVSI